MNKYKVLLALVTVAFRHSFSCSPKSLYSSFMVSSASSVNTTGVLYAVNRALEIINNDSTLLTSYKLLYTNGKPLDTQVYMSAYTVLVEIMDGGPQPVMREGKSVARH